MIVVYTNRPLKLTLVFEIIGRHCDVFILFLYRKQLNIEKNKITIEIKQVDFSHQKELLFMKDIWNNKRYMQIQTYVLVSVYCVERISSSLVIAC